MPTDIRDQIRSALVYGLSLIQRSGHDPGVLSRETFMSNQEVRSNFRKLRDGSWSVRFKPARSIQHGDSFGWVKNCNVELVRTDQLDPN